MKKIVSALTNGLFKASQVIQAYKGVTHAPIVVPVAKFWTPPEQSTPTVTAKSIASPHVVSEIPVIAPKVTEAVSEVKSSEAEATPVSATIEPPPLPALTEEEKKEIIAEAEKHQDNELRGLSSAIKDVVIIMDIAPQPLSEKEAEADPMRVILLMPSFFNILIGCWSRVESGSVSLGSRIKHNCHDSQQNRRNVSTSFQLSQGIISPNSGTS